MIKSKLIFFLFFIIVFSCKKYYSSKIFTVNEKDLFNGIEINFEEHENPVQISLDLENKAKCDMQIGIYNIFPDSISLWYSVNILDILDEVYIQDWHSKKVKLKALERIDSDCEKLDLKIMFSYFESDKF